MCLSVPENRMEAPSPGSVERPLGRHPHPAGEAVRTFPDLTENPVAEFASPAGERLETQVGEASCRPSGILRAHHRSRDWRFRHDEETSRLQERGRTLGRHRWRSE